MSSTFLAPPKPHLQSQNNEKNQIFFFHKSKICSTTTRAEAITTIAAPKRKINSTIFTELSVQSIPQTDLHVRDIVKRQTKRVVGNGFDDRKPHFRPAFLDEAYEQCKNICSEYAKTFYLGASLILKTLENYFKFFSKILQIQVLY